ADSRIITSAHPTPSRSTCSPSAPSPYSSTITCAFDPPAPNDEIPAIPGTLPPSTPGPSHLPHSPFTPNPVFSKSICGFNPSACSEGTISSCSICNNTFVSPAIPAADSQCPMFDFTDPIRQYPLSWVCCRKALLSAAISIGSPSLVPVPCAST